MSYHLRQYPMQSGLTTEVWKIDSDMTNQILDATRTQNLDDILTYANRFHHDTNRALKSRS